MAKKSAAKKKTVEEVVEEVKDEGIEVEVVAEEPKEETMVKEEKTKEVVKKDEKELIFHESGQWGWMDDDGNFLPEM